MVKSETTYVFHEIQFTLILALEYFTGCVCTICAVRTRLWLHYDFTLFAYMQHILCCVRVTPYKSQICILFECWWVGRRIYSASTKNIYNSWYMFMKLLLKFFVYTYVGMFILKFNIYIFMDAGASNMKVKTSVVYKYTFSFCSKFIFIYFLPFLVCKFWQR